MRLPLGMVEVVDGGTADATTPGATYTTVGGASYYDMGDCSEFTAFVNVLQAASGTSPTLDVRIEHSADLVGWATLLDFAQIVGAATPGVVSKSVPGPGTSDPKTFARYIRFRAKTGGTTPVFTYNCNVSKTE